MIIFLSIVHYIVCLVLIVVILLQAGRGHGLTGGAFGGDSTQSIFGTKTTAFMTKVTTASAIGFLITCLMLAIFTSVKSKSLLLDSKRPLTIPTLPQAVEEAAVAETQDASGK
ncbi:MAG: preprotein translocase subunit SecG [Candidatus Omnitrophica bacterium]|nr:preprotein translocase subunit SecG [Candidatus Omnitrophota bacterium]